MTHVISDLTQMGEELAQRCYDAIRAMARKQLDAKEEDDEERRLAGMKGMIFIAELVDKANEVAIGHETLKRKFEAYWFEHPDEVQVVPSQGGKKTSVEGSPTNEDALPGASQYAMSAVEGADPVADADLMRRVDADTDAAFKEIITETAAESSVPRLVANIPAEPLPDLPSLSEPDLPAFKPSEPKPEPVKVTRSVQPPPLPVPQPVSPLPPAFRPPEKRAPITMAPQTRTATPFARPVSPSDDGRTGQMVVPGPPPLRSSPVPANNTGNTTPTSSR